MGVTERATRVRGLAESLTFFPRQNRAEIADKLDGLGMRQHAELAIPEDGVRALAGLLYCVAPPMRMMFAYQLYGMGYRHEPDVATLDLVREGPPEMGNHAPQHVVKKKTIEEDSMDLLRQVPELAHIADKIEAAQADQATAARIRETAPKTEPERVALARELGIDAPDDVSKRVGELKAQIEGLE